MFSIKAQTIVGQVCHFGMMQAGSDCTNTSSITRQSRLAPRSPAVSGNKNSSLRGCVNRGLCGRTEAQRDVIGVFGNRKLMYGRPVNDGKSADAANKNSPELSRRFRIDPH